VLNTLHNLAFYMETMRKVREEMAGELVAGSR
jgi:queuine/archaeosine tRNA-ribosyltransferase